MDSGSIGPGNELFRANHYWQFSLYRWHISLQTQPRGLDPRQFHPSSPRQDMVISWVASSLLSTFYYTPKQAKAILVLDATHDLTSGRLRDEAKLTTINILSLLDGLLPSCLSL